MLLVYRFEHDAKYCKFVPSRHYWHGVVFGAGACAVAKPNFGVNGEMPEQITPQEICAVTRQQFPYWVSLKEEMLPGPAILIVPPEWTLVCYEVEEDFTYFTENQVVFDPSLARRIGAVDPATLYKYVGKAQAHV